MPVPASGADGSRPLLTESAMYAGFEAAQNGLALLTVGVLLNRLGPYEFGQVTMAIVASQIATALSTFGAEFTLLRKYLQWSESDRRAAAAWIVGFAVVWSLVLGGVGWGVEAATGFPDGRIALLGWWSGLALGIRGVPLSLARVQGRLRLYGAAVVGGSALQSALQIGLVMAGGAATGFVAGQLAGAIGSAVLVVAATAGDWWTPRPKLPRDAFTYTVSILPANLANRILAVADRALLAQFVSLEALGAYGLAARLAMPVKLVVNSLRMAVSPALTRAEKAGHLDDVFVRTARLSMHATVVAGAAIALAAHALYVTAWAPHAPEVVAVLALLLWAQVIAAGQSTVMLRVYYSSAPGRSAIATVTAALVLIGLLALLAPRFGGRGAALAEVTAGAVGAALAWWACRDVVGGRAIRTVWVGAVVFGAVAGIGAMGGRAMFAVSCAAVLVVAGRLLYGEVAGVRTA